MDREATTRPPGAIPSPLSDKLKAKAKAQSPFQAVLVVEATALPPKGPGHFPVVLALDQTFPVPSNRLAPKARQALPGILQAFLRRNPQGGRVPALLYPKTEGCRLDPVGTLLAKLYTTQAPPLPPGRFRVVGVVVGMEGDRLEVEIHPNAHKGTLAEAFTLCLLRSPGLAASWGKGEVWAFQGRLEGESLVVEEAEKI